MKKVPTLRKNRSLMAGACAAGALFAGCLTAGAAPITINSFSFAGHAGNTTPSGWSGGTAYDDYSDANLSSAVGVGGDGGSFITVGVGGNTNIAIFQNTTYAAQLGDIFTFTLAVGERIGQSGSKSSAADYVGTFSLRIGNAVVASNLLANTGDPIAGGWANASVSYTATAADVGQFVGIQIGGMTVRGQFDNARLNVTPIPEPGTFGFIAGAAALMLGMVRRRRAS